MNGIINESDAFIARLNKDIDAYVGSNEWRHDKMKLAIKMQDSERRGVIQTLKDSISIMRELKIADSAIFEKLHQKYHLQFSDEEIRKLMSEAK